MKIGITERGDAALDFKLIDFSKVDAAVLITKSPHVLFKHKDEIPVPYIVHCTITGLGDTKVEPNVKPYHEGPLHGYFQFCEELDTERVVLRVDPIIATRKAMDAALAIISNADSYSRVRISFADMYPHVVWRFEKAGLPIPYRGHADLALRQQYLAEIKAICPQVEVCGEPGLMCHGCISSRDLHALGLTGILDHTGK